MMDPLVVFFGLFACTMGAWVMGFKSAMRMVEREDNEREHRALSHEADRP